MVSFSEYYPRLSAWFEGEIYPLGNGLTIYFRDITERKRQEMTLRLEKEVLEMNALPESSLDLTVDHFLKGIENIYPGMLCSVILLREDKQHIKPLSSPSIPKEYSKAIDWTPIGPKAGSCGTAMFLKKAVYVTNIQTDPLGKSLESWQRNLILVHAGQFPSSLARKILQEVLRSITGNPKNHWNTKSRPLKEHRTYFG